MPKARYNVGRFSVRSDIPNSGSMASPTNHPASPPIDNDEMQWNPTHYAWFVVALLVPVALLNYLDRQMLAAMKASVSADTGIVTSEQWGTVLALFKWVYAGLSPIGGLVADRFSRRHVIAISLFVWSAVTWSTGLVADYQQLLITRALMGISEAFYIPAALALITEYHPRATRSRAVSMHQMGIYFGVILGGFSGYVADSPDYGWRWLFGLCGVIGIVYACPLFFLLKNPASTQPRTNASEQDASGSQNKHVGHSLRELLSNGAFLLLVLYFTLPAIPAWIIRDWMPAILKKEYGISQGLAGVSATVYLQIAAIVGAIIGGYWADRWMRSSERGRIYVSAIGISLVVPAMFGAGYAPTTGSLAVAVGFLILFGIGWGFFDCNNMPILCQLVRPQLRATGYGIMNLVSISCGGLGDWAFGKLEDMHVPLLVIFASFASFAVISVLIVLSIRPRYCELDPSNSSNPIKS